MTNLQVEPLRYWRFYLTQEDLPIVVWKNKLPNLREILNGQEQVRAWVLEDDAIPNGDDVYWGVVNIIKENILFPHQTYSARIEPTSESKVRRMVFARHFCVNWED